MDLRLLRYFVACVEHKTMHAAAAAVHVSQPALSKAVHSLEQHLGVKLLDRRPRGVVPTRYGETLFRYAKMIDSEVRRAVAEIDAMRGMTRGMIVVGVIPTMSTVMANVARRVMETLPGLKLKLKIAFSAELTHALLDGELDLALLLLPADSEPLGLTFEPLVQTGPKVAVRRDHPLTKRETLTLADLAEFPWLIPEFPPSHRAIVNRVFLNAGVTPPTGTIEVSTVILFDAVIRQTDLVTIVPSTLLSARSTDLVALETDFDFALEQVGLAYRQNSTLLPGARAVIDLVHEECSALPDYVGTSPARQRDR
jgi:DNA-binding transcriptional LysR family regulator